MCVCVCVYSLATSSIQCTRGSVSILRISVASSEPCSNCLTSRSTSRWVHHHTITPSHGGTFSHHHTLLPLMQVCRKHKLVQKNDLSALLIAPMQHQCHYQLLFDVRTQTNTNQKILLKCACHVSTENPPVHKGPFGEISAFLCNQSFCCLPE